MSYRQVYIITLISSFISLHAQTAWRWQNPLPQGNNLNSVACLPGTDKLVFVGDIGTVVQYSNAEKSWVINNSVGNFTGVLNSVFFVDSITGYAVANAGKILKTTDGGDTWYLQNSGTPHDLVSIFFPTNETGYTVGTGRNILKTTDGGMSWVPHDSGIPGYLNAVFFINPDTGYVTSDYGNILRTMDGGNNWENHYFGTDKGIKAISFMNANDGYAVGFDYDDALGVILKTTNGGDNWIEEYSGSSPLLTVKFKGSFGIMTDSWGNSWATTDGGDTWTFESTNVLDTRDVCILDSSIAVVVGDKARISITEDAGKNWRRITSGAVSGVGSLNVINPDTLFALSWNVESFQATIVSTTNGGENWIFQDIGFTKTFQSLFFVNSKLAYAAGNQGTIIKTTDHGITWLPLNSGVSSFLSSIYFIDPNIGFAVGDQSTIIKTTDGGNNWSQLNAPNGIFFEIYFVNSDTGFITSFEGKIFKTTDQGINWSLVNTGGTESYLGLYFIDESLGFVVGNEGGVLRTVDGGENWIPLNSGVSTELTSVYFIDNNIGFVTGVNGLILKTIDGGNNWFRIRSGTNNALHSCSFIDENTGWVTGTNGTILKTNTGGVVGINEPKDKSSTMSNTFSLLQNYPNPFNPSTTIRFTLSTAADVELAVLNIRGQVVAEILAERRSAGTHSEVFDASGLPSGIYFYRLTTGQFSETRKMVVVR